MIFKDRIGIVADISALIAKEALNIVSMEVIREEDRAQVYMELENSTKETERQELFEVLGNITDLTKIRFIETLQQEERENQFRVVLDNISDGVVSIDHKGHITTINRMARVATNSQDQPVLGKSIETMQLPDYALLECLNGKRYNNVKKTLITASRKEGKQGLFEIAKDGTVFLDEIGEMPWNSQAKILLCQKGNRRFGCRLE